MRGNLKKAKAKVKNKWVPGAFGDMNSIGERRARNLLKPGRFSGTVLRKFRTHSRQAFRALLSLLQSTPPKAPGTHLFFAFAFLRVSVKL
jgi:hypothetical protein